MEKSVSAIQLLAEECYAGESQINAKFILFRVKRSMGLKKEIVLTCFYLFFFCERKTKLLYNYMHVSHVMLFFFPH